MRSFLILLPLVVVLAGCRGGEDGVDAAAVEAAQAPLVAAAKRSGGDWSKMTPEEQKLFLERTRGDERSAKAIAGLMAGGPPGGKPR